MPIIIKVHNPPKVADNLIGTIRITAEAETALRELGRQTGLSLRHLASTIIIQGAEQVEIKEVK